MADDIKFEIIDSANRVGTIRWYITELHLFGFKVISSLTDELFDKINIRWYKKPKITLRAYNSSLQSPPVSGYFFCMVSI